MRIMNNYFRALAGMVYMMTNNEILNQIIAFYGDMNGMLTLWVPTQLMVRYWYKRGLYCNSKRGVDPLASQGALSLSRDGRFLLTVNAGSHSISSFIITDSRSPVLVDVKPSGGAQPNK